MTISPPAAPLRSQARPARPRATSSTGARATAGQRAGAYLIDVAIIALVGALVGFATGSLVLVAVAVIELWVIGWIWEGHTGATPGNLICGIRTVQRDADVSVGARGLFLRSLVLGLSHIVPVLLPVGLTASGLLDGLAGARVIDVRKTRLQAAGGVRRGLDLEARVTGADSATSVIAAQPGVITQTPLTPPPAPGVIAQAPGAQASRTPPPAAQPPVAQAVPQPPAPDVVPLVDAGVPVFQLADGTVIQATGFGFIGRAPRAPESIPDAILIRVPDGTRSLSRTHAAFGIEDEQLWVQDLGSANGASVRHLGGSVTELAPHVPSFLVPGDVLVLGGDAELAFQRVAVRGARPAVASAESPAQAAPAPAAAEEHAQPSRPVAEPVPAAAAPTVIALQFHDGTTVPIHGLGYIGRAPRLPEGEHPDAALIAVPDGDRSVSRTHGRFGIVDGQTWFEDLGSGNGSSLRTPDGRSGPMTPHQRFGLLPGMVLQIGDCVIRVVTV